MGEFEILTELGRGGMAAVYLARDLTVNRQREQTRKRPRLCESGWHTQAVIR
jgi:hypothetical protein